MQNLFSYKKNSIEIIFSKPRFVQRQESLYNIKIRFTILLPGTLVNRKFVTSQGLLTKVLMKIWVYFTEIRCMSFPCNRRVPNLGSRR